MSSYHHIKKVFFIPTIFQSIILLILLTYLPAFSQNTYSPVITDPIQENWRYVNFDELNGKGVRCLTSLNKGEEVWFGLDSGAVQYDGYNWKYFKIKDGLPGTPVQKISASPKDEIVAATQGGLARYNKDKWNTIFQLKHTSLEFTSIEHLKSGNIACGSNKGLFLVTEEKIYLFTTVEKWNSLKEDKSIFDFVPVPETLLPQGVFNNFHDVLELSSGQLWLATTFLLEDEKGDVLTVSESEIISGEINNYNRLSNYYSLDFGYEQQFFQQDNGAVWIINKSNKIPAARFLNGKWEYISYGEKFGDDEYSESIVQTSDGKIWIAGIGNLYSLDKNNNWKKYSFQTSNIPQGHIGLHTGDNLDLWIFGKQSTVTMVDLSFNKWITYEGLNFQGQSSDGTKWFLSFEGNVISNNQQAWIIHNDENSLMDDPVSLFITSEDKVWAVGSQKNKATAGYLSNGVWRNFILDSLSWGVDYRAFTEASDGSVWVGASPDVFLEKGQHGGLAQIIRPYGKNPEIIYHKARTNGLQQLNAYGITQTADKRIWIGGSALNYFNGHKWNHLNNPKLNNFVNTLTYSENHGLLVGSRQHGLFIHHNDTWENYHVGNGLLSNTIISIAADNNSKEIWVATDKDFSYFNGNSWINKIFPEALTFTHEGGKIHITEENDLWISRSFRTWKRRSYTGMQPGEIIKNNFLTHRFRRDTIAPETYIISYSKEVDKAGITSIFWNGRHYFNREDPEDLYFSYKINDNTWSDFSHETNHTFTELSDGDYTFMVRAMDSDGNIDPTPEIINFTVAPPIWKQAWFILLILTFLIIVGFYQYQITKKRKHLLELNNSLTNANYDLEIQNNEIERQRDSLSELIKKNNELALAKLKFFTNITHEFRTPLSLILGPVEQLLSNKPDNKKLSNSYNLIKKNALRLHRLINQLLEIRRIETGTLQLNLKKADIVVFLKEIKMLFKPKAQGDGIALSFKSEFSSLEIYFDPDKIEKIIFNLLSNAFKHTLKGGKISLEILKPDPGQKNFIKIKVSDSGQGIDSGIKELIFERFTVGDSVSTEEIEESSGIGLSYIKDLIEFHKGTITVESKKGIGTEFIAQIPVDLKPETSSEESTFKLDKTIDAKIMATKSLLSYNIETEPLDGKVVLIVEDHKDMRFFIANLLENEYRVLTAADGSEGLQVLQEEYVDLIISDVMMPEIDGITFCNNVKSDPATSHIPVILLTALAVDEKRIDGYESGADSYLVKPFNPELLKARVKNLIEAQEELKKRFSEDLRFKPKDVIVSSFDEEFLDKLASLMEKNIAESDFDIASLCEMMGMSHMHFIRKVKQLTGKKPKDLLKSFRLSRAKQLLEQNKINVSEVGYMVGYDVPNSFTRAFKNEFGISPSQFAQNHSNEIDI
ncbi:hybrid sensor histidine kinase/response regulator transcription factor [Mangrovivirga cuniculi]|uniref:histidine kinase n=1 Tax=Mangrovivirga cuniculi TaxID=2715131 RepID=A0A4D7JL79_9BACT|nr:hybrid sensor histidine kinase/response regulator transcription factor [Mangrovivirga cuniculi]QCK13282.1 hypothetical protein DCC35_00210 [Mangrovivirga cuniculi]